MQRYRYLAFDQKGALLLGVLQVACAALCVVCGLMDAAFRKNTALSTTRIPVWGGLITAVPGVLALLFSQRKHPTLLSCMVVSAILSFVVIVMVSVYSCVTLSYGEEEEDIFIHHHSADVTFVLHGMVRGSNATILLTCCVSLLLNSLMVCAGCSSLPCCSLMVCAGCRSLPCCSLMVCAGCDTRTGLETLVPQTDTELCSWHGGDDVTLFDSPSMKREAPPPPLPAYSRLT